MLPPDFRCHVGYPIRSLARFSLIRCLNMQRTGTSAASAFLVSRTRASRPAPGTTPRTSSARAGYVPQSPYSDFSYMWFYIINVLCGLRSPSARMRVFEPHGASDDSAPLVEFICPFLSTPQIFFVFSSPLNPDSTPELGQDMGAHIATHGDGAAVRVHPVSQ